MKRVVCMFLTLFLLLISGCAGGNLSPSAPMMESAPPQGEPLAQRLQAPERVTGEFASPSGISRVTVDASVRVPEAYQVNVYEALPRVFTDEEIRSVLERYEDEIGWYYAERDEPYDGAMPPLDERVADFDMYHLWVNNIPFEVWFSNDGDNLARITEKLPKEQAENYVYSSCSVMYGRSKRTGELAWMPALSYERSNIDFSNLHFVPLTDGKAEDCTITPEEAIAMADAEVHALAPDYEVSAYGQVPPYWMYTKYNAQYYLLRYTRHMDGIPVNNDYGGEDMSMAYGYASGLGVITVVVNDSGVLSLDWKNPYDVGKTLESDVELLPFDDIWDIFSNIALLSIQHLEVNENLHKNELAIYDVRFGYMTMLQADGSYRYMPVWDFYGIRSLAGVGEYGHADEGDPIYDWSEITINAIDGTVVDRDLGY